MPYQEILDAIKWYDSKKPYVDELKLVQDLSQKYNLRPVSHQSRLIYQV